MILSTAHHVVISLRNFHCPLSKRCTATSWFSVSCALPTYRSRTHVVETLASYVRTLGIALQRDIGKLQRPVDVEDAAQLQLHNDDSQQFLIDNLRNMQEYLQKATGKVKGGLRGLQNNAASVEWQLRKMIVQKRDLEAELTTAEAVMTEINAQATRRVGQIRGAQRLMRSTFLPIV